MFTYREVVQVFLRHAMLAYHEVIIIQQQSSMDQVLLCTTEDDVSADVYALLRLDVTHDGQFAVSFVC